MLTLSRHNIFLPVRLFFCLAGLIAHPWLATGPALPATESPAEQLQKEFVSVADKVGPAVVSIIPTTIYRDPYLDDFLLYFFGFQGKRYLQQGFASGVIIDPRGYILTNEHVLGDAQEISVRLPDGREFPAELKGADPEYDLAVIKIDAENLPSARLGNSDDVKIGQWAIAIGNPFGVVVNNPQPSLTVGVISALNRRITAQLFGESKYYEGVMQTDAAINPGNSGGPLVNLQGQVIGINTAIFTTSGGYQGIGFAIPINRARAILEDLKAGREVTHGWLGVWIEPLTESARIIAKYPGPSGARVRGIERASPAEIAGIRAGDIITRLNGQEVRGPRDLTKKVRATPLGSKVEVSLWREGEERKVQVQIAARGEQARVEPAPAAGEEYSWRGLTVTDLSPVDARESSGANFGVRIGRVQDSAPAAQAGLEANDLIDEINHQAIKNLEDFDRVTQKINGSALLHTNRGYFVLPAEKQ